jgi:hypothetical protein
MDLMEFALRHWRDVLEATAELALEDILSVSVPE